MYALSVLWPRCPYNELSLAVVLTQLGIACLDESCEEVRIRPGPPLDPEMELGLKLAPTETDMQDREHRTVQGQYVANIE